MNTHPIPQSYIVLFDPAPAEVLTLLAASATTRIFIFTVEHDTGHATYVAHPLNPRVSYLGHLGRVSPQEAYKVVATSVAAVLATAHEALDPAKSYYGQGWSTGDTDQRNLRLSRNDDDVDDDVGDSNGN